MKLLIFLCLFLGGIFANAQPGDPFRQIDSLLLAGAGQEALILVNTLERQLTSPEAQLRLTSKKIEAFIATGQIPEAENLLTGFQPSSPLAEAESFTNRGALQLVKGRNDLALEYLEQAQRVFVENGNQETQERARCLALLGFVYSSTGKYNQAEANQRMALEIRMKLFGPQSEEVAASYNDLGLVYSQLDADKALEYYEMALAIYKKNHGNEHQKIAVASTNIGMMYNQLELYGDAVNNLETALAIWQKKYPNGHPNAALALSNLGQTYSNMGNQKAALEYFEKALAIYLSYYHGKHSDIAYTHNLIGGLLLNEGRFDEALKEFQKALVANSPAFADENISRNPAVTGYYNAKVLLYTLRFKSQALEGRHFGKTLRIEDLKLALSGIHSCDSLIDDIRHHSQDESDKLELGEISSEVYEDGVRIAHELSEMSLDYKRYREEAFYFAEKSKSAVLLESIADSEAKSFAGIPSALLDEEKELKAQAALLAQKLAQKPSEDEEKKLRQALFAVQLSYNEFIKRLEKDFPNYFNLKFNPSSPSIPQLQQILDARTAIISYFLSERNDKKIYLFIITNKNFRLTSVTLPDNFEKLISGLRNGLYYNYQDAYQNASHTLSRLLVPSLPKRINALVIIPAGRLGTVPFETLVFSRNKAQDYRDMPFLVKHYAMSYEFSAGLMLQKTRSLNPAGPPSIFLCAPVDFEKENLDDLPGTEKEVKTIAGLFKERSSVSTYHDANETSIKSGGLSKYTYLHFATHGIVDEANPELSRIFLNADSAEDGSLYAGEIYNLNLNADLTVLSACQTGLGKISKGEGVIGLSRALVYAGSRNIIVSFWSVADESTSQLMTSFYKTLLTRGDHDYREALRQAKIAMITGDQYAAPYFWAPFVLIGF